MSDFKLNTVTVYDKVSTIETTITVVSRLSVPEILKYIREHQDCTELPKQPVPVEKLASGYTYIYLRPDDIIEDGDEYYHGAVIGWVLAVRVGEKCYSKDGDFRRKVKV